jgi:hypothetical protein
MAMDQRFVVLALTLLLAGPAYGGSTVFADDLTPGAAPNAPPVARPPSAPSTSPLATPPSAPSTRLRLECLITTDDCGNSGDSCYVRRKYKSVLMEVDFDKRTWRQIWTRNDGSSAASTGILKDADEFTITLISDDRITEKISRVDGSYSSVEKFDLYGKPATGFMNGSCKRTSKDLPRPQF